MMAAHFLFCDGDFRVALWNMIIFFIQTDLFHVFLWPSGRSDTVSKEDDHSEMMMINIQT